MMTVASVAKVSLRFLVDFNFIFCLRTTTKKGEVIKNNTTIDVTKLTFFCKNTKNTKHETNVILLMLMVAN